ncbi:MAG: hypothetical protein RLZZ450_2876 [Pseudomonadota bacterium]|jgi:hypothetical protein
MRAPFVLSIRLILSLASLSCVALPLTGCAGKAEPVLQIKSMPEGGDFTGVWHSPQYGEMHVRQSGASAIGRYTKDERKGRIQGNVEGDVMRFEWSEKRELIAGRSVLTKGHGYFRIIRDEAEKTWKIIGEWGNDAAERGGGPWNAVKSKSPVRLDAAGNETDGNDVPSDSNSSSGSGGDDEGGFGGKDVSGGALDNL